MGSAGEYVRDGTVRLESPVRGDAGASVVALAGGTGVELVTADRTTSVSFDGPVEAVAVGRYVAVLVGGTVHAVTEGGVTVWSTDVEGASDVGAAGEGVVGVLSGDRVVGLDTESGSELFAVARREDRPPPDGLFGAPWGLALPAWSYLTAYDSRGDERFDSNLDGTVETVGTVEDRVIVGLRSGEAVALTPDGHQAWRRPLGARWLAPTGGSSLPALTGDGPVLVKGDGETEPLSVADDADGVYRTHGGSVCCVVDGDTVTVHRRLEQTPENVRGEILTEELEPGGRLRVRCHNEGTEPTVTELTASAADAEFEDSTAQVSLGAGANRTVEWTVESVGGDETAVTVTAGERTVADGTLAVAESSPAEALTVSAEPVSVEDGTVTVRIEATNEGRRPVDDARVDPPGQRLPTIDPGDSTALEQSAAFEPGWNRTLQVRGRAGSEQVSAETEVALPDAALDLSITRTEARRGETVYADVRLENDLDVPVTDRLQVGAPDDDLERPVEIGPNGAFTLAVPLSNGGTVEAAVAGLGLTRRTDVTGPETTARPDSMFDTGNEPAVRVERQAADAMAGYGIQERLSVRNVGGAPAEDLRVSAGDAEWTTGNLDPGEEVTLVRRHVAPQPGRVTLAGGQVSHAEGEVPIEPREVSVRPAEVKVDATVETGTEEHAFTLAIENRSDERLRLETAGAELSTGDPITWEGEALGALRTIRPGQSASETWQVPVTQCDLPERAVRVAFVYRRPSDRDRTNLETLATVDGGIEQPVELAVTNGADLAAGEYGYLEVSVTNAGTRPIEGLSVEADHPGLTTMYVPDTDRYLGPNESLDHEIDVNPTTAGDVGINLTVEGELTGSRFHERYTVSGPVASAGEWTDSLLAEWDVSVEERASDEADRTGEADVVRTGYVRENQSP